MSNTCTICGGNAGRLAPEGYHYFCAALQARGLPTPSLGTRCENCNGSGTCGKGGALLSFDLGPAAIARSIAAQFPPCPACAGKGYSSVLGS